MNLLSLVNKKWIFSAIAKELGVPTHVVTELVEKAEDRLGVDITPTMLTDDGKRGLFQRFGAYISPPMDSVTAKIMHEWLKVNDTAGVAFPVIQKVSEMPFLDLPGDYANVEEFFVKGLFPSLRRLQASIEPVCADCGSADVIVVERVSSRTKLYCENCEAFSWQSPLPTP